MGRVHPTWRQGAWWQSRSGSARRLTDQEGQRLQQIVVRGGPYPDLFSWALPTKRTAAKQARCSSSCSIVAADRTWICP
jgi:hypothetical protein